MKKTYFAPESRIVKITTVKMIALSLDKNDSYETTEYGNPENSLGRRSNSIWDDEEE